MNGRQRSIRGIRSHESGSTTRKKIAKVAVGKSTRGSYRQFTRLCADTPTFRPSRGAARLDCRRDGRGTRAVAVRADVDAVAREPARVTADHARPVDEDEVLVVRRRPRERAIQAAIRGARGGRTRDRRPDDAAVTAGRSHDG